MYKLTYLRNHHIQSVLVSHKMVAKVTELLTSLYGSVNADLQPQR